MHLIPFVLQSIRGGATICILMLENNVLQL